MTEYIRLLEIVKNRMEIREDSFGSVIAAKIHNREEFDLMVSFWAVAYSSCYKREKIIGKFVGEDWYFIESDTDDYGMDGKSTTYYTQTLSEKKQKFWEFCRKFDADEPTIDTVPVRHGHWIDMGDFEQCSACKGTRLKEFNSFYGNVTWIETAYCPQCGAKMDEVTE